MGRAAVLYSDVFLQHVTRDHPERADRLRAIMFGLDESGLSERITKVLPREATEEELALVHTPEHIEAIRKTRDFEHAQLDADTQTSAGSYDAALQAAGGLCKAVDLVVSGEFESVFAMVRPPGHHAERDRAMGFCLFNNIAVAARYAIERHRMERVLIVDWDVHHGNGTQNAFYGDPRVLYMSTHQYPFYPGTGHHKEVGTKDGHGFTINVPLPGRQGDEEFRSVFDEILIPIAAEFRPALVMVSAGFDAHEDDPLGGMRVTGTGFAYMMKRLLEVSASSARGKVVLALEGGYSMRGLQESTQAVVRELLGDGEGEVPEPSGAIGSYLDTLRAHFRTYWKGL
ncbi:MAG: histone deacetylase [Nitrospirae bacterium]|nr:histone deacetylase [Nitrospirota bacterium]